MARLAIAVAGLLVVGAATAQEQAPVEAAAGPRAPSLAETHDGLYLNVAAGLGLGHQSNPDGRADFLGSSSGRSLTLAVGAAVRRNLLLGARFLAAWPASGVGGATRWASAWGLRGFAADLTWYVGPRNLYLGAAPAVTYLTMQPNAGEARGVGLRLAGGREWWVSDNWGIGLALEYLGSLNRMRREDGSARQAVSHWLGLALSVTYN